ncbi:MAG: hypothetical protein AB7F86_06045 [Bdellovibrionales bacterium]
MKLKNQFSTIMVVVFASSTFGCGQSFRAVPANQEFSSFNVETDDYLAKAEQAALDAQAAMDEAHALVAEITDENGNINIGLFKKPSSGASTQALLDPVINQLRAAFDKIFAKVKVVKDQIGLARQTLNDALAKLDPNNPAHAAQIELIKAQLAKIDQLEAQFSASMHALASKLDLAIAGLDGVISGLVTFIPGWGSLVGLALDFLVMGDVKAVILELKAKLMAL